MHLVKLGCDCWSLCWFVKGHRLSWGLRIAFACGSRMEHFVLRSWGRAELHHWQSKLIKKNVVFLFEQINNLPRRKRRRKRKAKRYYLIPQSWPAVLSTSQGEGWPSTACSVFRVDFLPSSHPTARSVPPRLCRPLINLQLRSKLLEQLNFEEAMCEFVKSGIK